MSKTYDAIIVGARCAGSPTAMLLARKGYKVLVVDRTTFPSDTVSTHVVHPLGTAADGRHSTVAEFVRPEQYNEKPPLLCGYYTYWSGLPMDGRFEIYIRPSRGFAAAPTHDDLTLVVGGWPYAEFEANKKDIEG